MMALFGFAEPVHISVLEFKVQKSVDLGDDVHFSFILKTNEGKLGKLRIEYAVGFLKKNGRLSRKLFKLSESENTRKEKLITKFHSFRKISTRIYYAGVHELAVIVNGCELACRRFQVNEVP